MPTPSPLQTFVKAKEKIHATFKEIQTYVDSAAEFLNGFINQRCVLFCSNSDEFSFQIWSQKSIWSPQYLSLRVMLSGIRYEPSGMYWRETIWKLFFSAGMLMDKSWILRNFTNHIALERVMGKALWLTPCYTQKFCHQGWATPPDVLYRWKARPLDPNLSSLKDP